MKKKVSDSLDNVPNENVVTHLGTDRPTDSLTNYLNCQSGYSPLKNENVLKSCLSSDYMIKTQGQDTDSEKCPQERNSTGLLTNKSSVIIISFIPQRKRGEGKATRRLERQEVQV